MSKQETGVIHESGLPGINLHDISALQRVRVREDANLRPLNDGDAPRLLEILDADPEIRQNVTVASRMQTEEDVQREVVVMEADPELIRYAITDEDDKCIGLVSFWLDSGFFGQEPLPNTYGFGYFIDPAERGRGIVTDSVKSLIDVASRNIPGVEGFTAFCVDANKDSLAVLANLDFEPTEKLYPEPTHGWMERQYIRGLSNE